jgi:Tfp pilus assembly protein PilF
VILAPGLLFLAATGPVVVMAPEGPAPAETEWIGAVVADALPRNLERLGVPAVDRANLRRALEKLGIPGTPVTRASGIRVAEALGASRLVTGSYRTEHDQVTLSLRLLEVERATLSAPLIASGPMARLPELIRGLAWDIALAGSTRPSGSRDEFLAREEPPPLEALQAYALALTVSDPAASARLLKRALALRPAYPEARLALGHLQVETREYEGARESLARIPAGSGVARTARFLEGVALLGLGRYAEASEIYAALAAEKPTAAALNNHGVALLRLGSRSPLGSAVLRRACDLEKGATDISFNLGFALLVEGQASAAAFWLGIIVERDPSDLRAQVVLAWAWRGSGRLAEASEIWREVIGRSPSSMALETPDLARRFERIRDSEGPQVHDVDDPDEVGTAAAHVARAEGLVAENRLEEALTELGRAAYLEPADPLVHLLMARVHRARGEHEKALASFRMSLWSRDDPAVRLEMEALPSAKNP